MSRHYSARQLATVRTLGQMLRKLRTDRKQPMWTPAAAAGMDSSLLSKIELGRRLPTDEQAAALARHFGVPKEQMQGALMAEKFLKDAAKNPAAVALALTRIAEGAGEYHVNRTSIAVHKPARVVNKAKKRD